MRYLDDLAPVRRYLELKAESERVTAELDALKPLITAALMEEDGEEYVYSGFRFTLQRRTSYRYSERIQEMQQHVKKLKRQEERKPAAERSVMRSIQTSQIWTEHWLPLQAAVRLGELDQASALHQWYAIVGIKPEHVRG